MPGENDETTQTTNEDLLSASLDQLLKAADAEGVVDQLKKGGQVYSGRDDEDGHGGGGGASSSDAGSLDNMMIGKFVNQGFSAEAAKNMVAAMTGAMKGKQGANEEEEEEEEDEGEDMTAYARGYADAKMGKSKTGDDDGDDALSKSHADDFHADPDISEAVNAAPFMEALTTKMVGSLDGLQKSIRQGRNKQATVNQAMAGAVYQMGTLIKSQSNVIDELGKRLGIVETTPVPAKGVQNPSRALALVKGMPGESGGPSDVPEVLNKSEAAAVLSYMRFEEGIDSVCGEPTGHAASFVESGGELSKGVSDYMMKWLATHPQKRDEALQYH